jgi:sugar lactone lactonase YvrE
MPNRAFRQVLFLITLSQPLVAQTTSAVSLFSSPNPSTYGAAVTITATVTPSAATGRVTFYDGDTVLGVRPVVGGKAVLKLRLSEGSRGLHAHYSGEVTYLPSDSASITVAPNPQNARVDRVSSRASASAPFGPYLISTIAGTTGPPTSIPGTSAVLRSPMGVVADPVGNVFLSDQVLNEVFRLGLDGNLIRVAGTGSDGYSHEPDGPAIAAQLTAPAGLALDNYGNLFIAEQGGSRVRRVSPAGLATTVAGNGDCPTNSNELGDGGPATATVLCVPAAVAVDSAGNLYIADNVYNVVRKVSTNGIITTVAGGAGVGHGGDGGPATAAQLNEPSGLALDTSGNLYIADAANYRVRRVSPTGTITTVAGNGSSGYNGDNIPATAAELGWPAGVAMDASGNLYIADMSNYRVRVVSGGIITTLAGAGSGFFSGDGGALGRLRWNRKATSTSPEMAESV